MDQLVYPISEQVKEVVQAVMEALRIPKSEEVPPSVAANSFEAEALSDEIIPAPVENCGNGSTSTATAVTSSARIGTDYVLCTPTMISKGDISPADICLSDMAGNIVAGNRLRTSELLLHLEIYRAQPPRPSRGPLPSPLRDGLLTHWQRSSFRTNLRIRDLHRPCRSRSLRNSRDASPSLRPFFLLFRTTTPSCSQTTA